VIKYTDNDLLFTFALDRKQPTHVMQRGVGPPFEIGVLKPTNAISLPTSWPCSSVANVAICWAYAGWPKIGTIF